MTAIELGHDYLVLTDHSPRLRVANGLSAARLTKQLGVVDAVNEHLSGDSRCSRNRRRHPRQRLADQDDACWDGSRWGGDVHSTGMDPGPMTKRMIGAIRNRRTNVLGHCTGRLVTGNRGVRKQSQFDARAVFEACAEHDVAVEINARPERRDPPSDLLALARDAGCVLAIDSDSHAPASSTSRCSAASAPRTPASTPTGW